jgi:ribosomal protein L7Ae-like RNA K-turn-binding protein
LGSKVLYLKVTRDKYELPLAVAEGATELAEMCGVTTNAVISGIWKEKRKGIRSCYKRIEIEE